MPKVENKIRVRGRSGKRFSIKVVLEGPADLIDALPSNEYKSAKKSGKEMTILKSYPRTLRSC
jgi:hypothetical protein